MKDAFSIFVTNKVKDKISNTYLKRYLTRELLYASDINTIKSSSKT